MPFTRFPILLRIIALALGLLLGFEVFFAFRIWQLRGSNPESSAFMAARLVELQESRPQAELKFRWIGYGAISPALKRAVVAAEDSQFKRHGGFDWEGIQRALEKNLEQGEFVAGGSTISQQLAKNLFLSGERTLVRKGQEAALTLMLEAILDKRRILEIYLNVIEWGDGVFGAEAAARHYFGVSAAKLDVRQATLLAAIVPRPRFYDRIGWTPNIHQRALTLRKHLRYVRLP